MKKKKPPKKPRKTGLSARERIDAAAAYQLQAALNSATAEVYAGFKSADNLPRDEYAAILTLTKIVNDAAAQIRYKFDPSQPRDDHGRWTDGGGSAGETTGMSAGNQPTGYRPAAPTERRPDTSTAPRASKPMKVDDAVQRIKDRAKLRPDDNPRCAQYVREAINSGGGLDVRPPPKRPGKKLPEARDYGKSLTDVGFKPAIKPTIPGEDFPPQGEHYRPERGDVVVIQATSKNESGHMAMYAGSGVGEGWISDFKQPDFWPGNTYRKEKPSYTIYRPLQ